jgi:outer membrane protein assembly factor BamB
MAGMPKRGRHRFDARTYRSRLSRSAYPYPMTKRFLAIGAAVALSLAWMPAAVVASGPTTVTEPGAGDWPQVRHDPSNSGYNPAEITISPSNVARLKVAWTARPDGAVLSSPVVANGVVYISAGGNLYAYAVGCASGGDACRPLWLATPNAGVNFTPAVADGVIYVPSAPNSLAAYSVNCAKVLTACQPTWTAFSYTISSSAAVSDGRVYVGTKAYDGAASAYDVGCASGIGTCDRSCPPPNVGATCDEVWAVDAGSGYSPAVAGGIVYLGSDEGGLWAYAAGDCSTKVASASPCVWRWMADTGSAGGAGITSSPVVANGVVYVGTGDGSLYAYLVGCADNGGSCAPLWTATMGAAIDSSPAVANGVVYVGSVNGNLYAYAADCASFGGSCAPLWTATTGGAIHSPPAVANGVVYVGSDDHMLYAFAVGCASGGRSCTPLWKGATGDKIDSSPVVANGAVYVSSADGTLYAFSLGGVTPPATSAAVSQALPAPGAPTWPLGLGLAAFVVGTLLTFGRSRTGHSRRPSAPGRPGRGCGSSPV